MLRRLGLCILLLALLFSTAPLSQGQALTASLTFDGHDRTYTVHLPPTYDDAQPMPLVIALHSFASSGKALQALTGLDTAADTYGFITAYPDSLDLTWNEGRSTSSDPLNLAMTDDGGFIDALIDALTAEYAIAADEVYLVGHGAGGLLAYRLACTLPERFAGVTVTSALLWNYHADLCDPDGAPVDLLITHGTADTIYPAAGRTLDSRPGALRILSLADTLAFWADYNGCTTEAAVTEGSITRYPDCAGGSLTAVNLNGVDHHWPRPGAYAVSDNPLDLSDLIGRVISGDESWPDLVTNLPAPDDAPSRTYTVYVPPQYDPAGDALPVVMALHGRPSNGASMAYLMDLNRVAAAQDFIAVYPDGIDDEWNYVRGFAGFQTSGVDDAAFLAALIDDLALDLNVDRSRVYVTGFSNGGFMTQRLACEAADVFAGFASFGATLFPGFIPICEDAPPVPIMLLHGTNDVSIPWTGIQQGDVVLAYNALDTVAFWAEHNGCDLELSDYTLLSEDNPTAQTFAHRYDFTDCTDRGAVVFYVIEGGGHNLPGVPDRLTPQIAGRVNMDVNAAEAAWSFFADHSLPEGD